MKPRIGTKVQGHYTNGIGDWSFQGRVTSIHHDTAGGNFSVARIELNTPIENRTALLMTLNARGEQDDDRFYLVEKLECENDAS